MTNEKWKMVSVASLVFPLGFIPARTRLKILGSLFFVSLCLVSSLRTVAANDSWTSVRTRNYLLVGNADEQAILQIATQLERFREVFARQFAGAALNAPVPTTVIVFKSDGAYRRYKPLFGGQPAAIDAYFQAGFDVNYITLSTDPRRINPYGLIFHESVHLLVNNKLRTAPAWVTEGMAEYFSTFDLISSQKDGAEKRVMIGKPVVNHILTLRQRNPLPLATLFEIDRNSPFYNERDKSSIFYAQSWALVHYLTHGNGGQRQPQLARFLEFLSTNLPLEQSFRSAFQADYQTIEKELRAYVRQDKYNVRLVPFAEQKEVLAGVRSVPLSEAEALAYLGDLLMHIERGADAEEHLKRALALNPELSMARASLGMLNVRQRRFAEAKEHLGKAIKTDPGNYLNHYYYAFALSRESMDSEDTVFSYPAKTADAMRSSLKRAIDLAPGFPESYRLLAFVNLSTNTQLAEAKALLDKALELSPGRHDFAYVLAQLQMRQKNYNAARATLEGIVNGNASARLRALARELLQSEELKEKNQPQH